jgi:HK97 family phage portal protein
VERSSWRRLRIKSRAERHAEQRVEGSHGLCLHESAVARLRAGAVQAVSGEARRGLTKIEPARDHSLYDLLTVRPNDWTTSFEFRETLVLHAAMGNAYVFKNVVRGKIIELILLNPGRVEKFQREDWSIYYKVTSKSGEVMEFPAETIWHVRGPSWDGYLGLDVMQLAREALGLSIATEETHARLHAKGVRPSGTYSVDGTLNPEQYKA